MRMAFRMGRAPSFSRKRHRQVFLTMAAAELALLATLVVAFTRYRPQFDLVMLSAGLMVALAAGSWVVRRSAVLAQLVFFLSLITLEAFLLVEPPFTAISIVEPFTLTSDALPLIFLLVDIAVLWFFVLRDIGSDEEEDEGAAPSRKKRWSSMQEGA